MKFTYKPIIIFLAYNFLYFSNFQSLAQVCLNMQSNDFEEIRKSNLPLNNFDLLLLGETHGLASNAILQSKFYSYLNAEKGVNNILIEWGRADAYLINEFFKTGNKSLLEHSSFGYFNWQEELDSWEYIRNNCSKNTKVYGVDFEREPSLTASIYFLLDKDSGLKEQLKTRLDTLKFSSNTDEFKGWLSENIPEEYKSEEILEILSNKASKKDFYGRDEKMFEYFLSIKKSGERYFGRFGTMHTQLDNTEVFAGMLNADYKLISINIHYQDSWYNEDVKVKYSFLNDKGFFKRKTIRNNLDYYKNVAPCNDYIIEVSPANKYIKEVALKGQYLIYLTDKKGYNY